MSKPAHFTALRSLSAAFFETYRTRLTQTLGPRQLAELEDGLQQMAAPIEDSLGGFPGWMA
jgi:hypothetical protein